MQSQRARPPADGNGPLGALWGHDSYKIKRQRAVHTRTCACGTLEPSRLGPHCRPQRAHLLVLQKNTQRRILFVRRFYERNAKSQQRHCGKHSNTDCLSAMYFYANDMKVDVRPQQETLRAKEIPQRKLSLRVRTCGS